VRAAEVPAPGKGGGEEDMKDWTDEERRELKEWLAEHPDAALVMEHSVLPLIEQYERLLAERDRLRAENERMRQHLRDSVELRQRKS
jgi:hypothetical protein